VARCHCRVVKSLEQVIALRGLAAGEFGTLHDAQLTIAREHGQPSRTALKQLIETRLSEPGHPALRHLRWVVSRFGGAGDGPGASASLIVSLSDGHANVALANREAQGMHLNLAAFLTSV
jgi:hypothetical protein